MQLALIDAVETTDTTPEPENNRFALDAKHLAAPRVNETVVASGFHSIQVARIRRAITYRRRSRGEEADTETNRNNTKSKANGRVCDDLVHRAP